MIKILCLLLTLSFSLIASAKTVICETNSAGINYQDGVKQCLYYCTDGCTEKQLIGPGFSGDFGAYNCYGSIIAIQPSANGQMSPNAIGFKEFELTISGFGTLWSSLKYRGLQKVVASAYGNISCRGNP